MGEQKICPNCQKEVESLFEFGMISCNHCGHLFIVDDKVASLSAESLFEPVPEAIPADGSVKLDEIAEFGNIQLDNMSSGALFYDVEISGIDTPELRSDLDFVLQDKKLGLSEMKLLTKVSGGILMIKELHPVAASVLVNRLKSTGLQVKWTTGQLIKKILVLALIFFASVGVSQITAVSVAQASDWAHHEISLNQSSIKINNLQDEIMELSAKKNTEPNPKKKIEILEDIKKKYLDLKESYKSMLQEMDHVRFEHPEKGDKTLRQYKHMKLKSLDELENDTSSEGQMLRLKKKAEMKYCSPDAECKVQ